MERSLDAHVISVEEAIAQGSTAGEMSAVANYHIRADMDLRSEFFRLTNSDKRKPSEKIKTRIREIADQRRVKADLIEALTNVARTMRKIGKV